MEKITNSIKHRVSIVIPTLNEEKNITLLLASISEQILNENVEISDIIVVDNGSVDKTLEIAGRYGALTICRPDCSIADLRNIGAEMATGDIIIFSDADNVFLNKYIVNNVVLILTCDCLSASGPDGLLPFGDATWLQNVWYYHTSVLCEQGQTIDVGNLSSGFFAIKARVFREVGGFNGNLSIGEDSEMSKRLLKNGHRLVKSNTIIVHNSGHPKTIWQFLKREYWHGDSIKHLMVHKNIDLLTVYIILNCLLWVCLAMCIFYNKPYYFIIINIVLIMAVPSFKGIVRVKRLNLRLVQLIFVYFLYVTSRSIALFKIL